MQNFSIFFSIYWCDYEQFVPIGLKLRRKQMILFSLLTIEVERELPKHNKVFWNL